MHVCKLFENPQVDMDAILKLQADADMLHTYHDIHVYYMTNTLKTKTTKTAIE